MWRLGGVQKIFEKIKQWVSAIAPMTAQVRVIEATAAANEQTPEGARYKVVSKKRTGNCCSNAYVLTVIA